MIWIAALVVVLVAGAAGSYLWLAPSATFAPPPKTEAPAPGGGVSPPGEVSPSPAPAPKPAPPPPPPSSIEDRGETWLVVAGLPVLAAAAFLSLFRRRRPAVQRAPEAAPAAAGQPKAAPPVPRAAKSVAASAAPGTPAASAAASDAAAIDVFISYSRIDRGDVDPLVGELETCGLKVWIDTEEQHAGMRYAGTIVRAIRGCRTVLIMCSQNAFRSDHVVREVYVAGDCRKPFIVFLLDDSELPDDFLYFLSGFPRLSRREIDRARFATTVRDLISAA